MLYLTELSAPLAAITDATMAVDPLVASDLGYAIKTWMADKPSLACRPWRASLHRNCVRITGWRAKQATRLDRTTYIGTQGITLTAGQTLALAGQCVALMRAKHRPHDAADNRADPERAYDAWLRLRLIDLMPYAAIDDLRIDRFSQRHVLRKVARGRHTRVAASRIPVVEATLSITVRDPEGVEAWVLHGVGPQKCFGYGAFVPALDNRETVQ